MFVFGEKELGDGSDENHFHLGFSTINLMKNIVITELFHIDCTYKIKK